MDAELPDEEEGTPVIRRTKKSAAAKVKDREGGSKIKGRLSFGAAAGDEVRRARQVMQLAVSLL